MLTATPLPSTTYGVIFTNATQSKFNVIYFILNIMGPYAWLFPASASQLAISIVMGLVLFAIFFGIAMRTRYVAVPIVVGIIVAPYLTSLA
jgi:2-hydroxychromene-2-carboxylate isomerase